MRRLIASNIFRKALILSVMLIGLAYTVMIEKVDAKGSTNNCCTFCDSIVAYCISHHGGPNDPYKTYAQCVTDLGPDCLDGECDHGC
jgi:hypothetical protein